MSWKAQNENIILSKHPHRIGFTSRYLISLIIDVIALFLLYIFRYTPTLSLFSIGFSGRQHYVWIPGLALLGIGILIFLFTDLHRRSIRYTVTNRRVNIEKGMLSKSLQEASLQQVQDVLVHQGAIQRILNVGDVEVRTEVGGQGALWLWDVPRPRDFEKAIFTK